MEKDSHAHGDKGRWTMTMVADMTVVFVILFSLALHLTGILLPGWWCLPPDHPYNINNNNINNDNINNDNIGNNNIDNNNIKYDSISDYNINNESINTTNDGDALDSGIRITTTYGLWSVRRCTEGGVCTEAPLDTSKSNAWLQVTQGFESMAVVFVALVLPCYVLSKVRDKMCLLLSRLSICFLAAAAVSIVIGMAVFLKKTAGLAPYPQRTTTGGHLDWPIFLSMASALLSVLLVVVITVRMRRHHVTETSVSSQGME